MYELIPVASATINSIPTLTCDARSLHTFLGVCRDFSNWIKARIAKYKFQENTDYITLAKNGERKINGLQQAIDYIITIDMAKELAMVENNEKGRQVRRYFIECERLAREAACAPHETPELAMARGLLAAEKYVEQLKAKIEADRPRVEFTQKIEISKTLIGVGEMAVLISQNGGPALYQNELFRRLRDEGYLVKQKGDRYNLPTKKAANAGVIVTKEGVRLNKYGKHVITRTPKITGKGQLYFMNKYRLSSAVANNYYEEV